MANIMHHGPYIAEIEYDEDADIFHGRTINLRDIITFQGRSTKELKKSFAETVAFYEKDCAAEGIEPEKPFTGKLLLRLPPDLHRAAVEASAAAGMSLNKWIAEQVERAAHQAA
jgi:predicted HicB family RNase H-like nuclease